MAVSLGADRGRWYVVKIADPSRSVELSRTFDAMFANSSAETKTTTEKGFVEGFASQVGDIGTILVSADKGETWQERKLPDDMRLFWLRGVSAAAGDRALVVGASGLAVTVEKDKVRVDAIL